MGSIPLASSSLDSPGKRKGWNLSRYLIKSKATYPAALVPTSSLVDREDEEEELVLNQQADNISSSGSKTGTTTSQGTGMSTSSSNSTTAMKKKNYISNGVW